MCIRDRHRTDRRSGGRVGLSQPRHRRGDHRIRLAGPTVTAGGRYNRLSDDARRHLCFDNPFIWETARNIDYPTRAVDGGGRPTSYPLWVFLLWMLLIHEYGSSRKVEEAFEDALHSPWPHIRAASRQGLADRPDLIPPETPPTRNQFNYALKHHLPANTDIIAATIRHRSQRLATDMGLG